MPYCRQDVYRISLPWFTISIPARNGQRFFGAEIAWAFGSWPNFKHHSRILKFPTDQKSAGVCSSRGCRLLIAAPTPTPWAGAHSVGAYVPLLPQLRTGWIVGYLGMSAGGDGVGKLGCLGVAPTSEDVRAGVQQVLQPPPASSASALSDLGGGHGLVTTTGCWGCDTCCVCVCVRVCKLLRVGAVAEGRQAAAARAEVLVPAEVRARFDIQAQARAQARPTA